MLCVLVSLAVSKLDVHAVPAAGVAPAQAQAAAVPAPHQAAAGHVHGVHGVSAAGALAAAFGCSVFDGNGVAMRCVVLQRVGPGGVRTLFLDPGRWPTFFSGVTGMDGPLVAGRTHHPIAGMCCTAISTGVHVGSRKRINSWKARCAAHMMAGSRSSCRACRRPRRPLCRVFCIMLSSAWPSCAPARRCRRPGVPPQPLPQGRPAAQAAAAHGPGHGAWGVAWHIQQVAPRWPAAQAGQAGRERGGRGGCINWQWRVHFRWPQWLPEEVVC